MVEASFKHYDLEMLVPAFDSDLTDLIIDLDVLRQKALEGSTLPEIFYQLKAIFHMLESLGSARIEGNNTTLAEYIEVSLEKPKKTAQSILEIQNIDRTIEWVELMIDKVKIDRAFICEIHRRLVDELSSEKEGDTSPGQFRKSNVRISRSAHRPPDGPFVDGYMEELIQFINRETQPKYDLIKTAIGHHRFAWIHPFNNGNGRTVRLLTYAMLLKQKFNVGRIINPTAIFCIDRQSYYDHLAKADRGTKDGILCWTRYVLRGLKNEFEKISLLANYEYLKTKILLPMLKEALVLKYITPLEEKILSRTVELEVIQAKDIKEFFSGKAPSSITYQINALLNKKLLIPKGKRKYVICFYNNLLLRVICKMLDKHGFLSVT